MKYAVVVAAAILCCAGAWCTPRQLRDVSDTFSERATQLLNSIKMSEKHQAAIPQILHDLERVLSTKWPGCEVLLFGSTVTGLALVGSDIDAYVVLPDRSVKSYGLVNYRAVHVLKQYPDYANMQPKCFFISFQHVPTQTKIDLLINDIEGGRNSALLRYFLHLDERAMKLALIVKYWWAQIRRLAGYKLIPSYGMSCLVVFYLQQMNIVPPVTLVQKHAKPFMYKNWNTGFDKIHYKSRNNESLYQLLGGFFEYYDNFNYEEFIISPFMGHPVKRKLFKSLWSVPPEFIYYHRNVGSHRDEPMDLSDAVIIQDLIFHNKNLAVLIKSREGSLFIREFRRAARAFRENDESTFLDEILDAQITETLVPK